MHKDDGTSISCDPDSNQGGAAHTSFPMLNFSNQLLRYQCGVTS